MMALVDLNHIQFYQPPTKASLPREKIPKASNANAPAVIREGKSSKVPGPSNGWGQRPWCDDAIEFIDMTDSPPREHLSPAREPLPDLQERSFFDEGSSTGLVTANGHCNTSGLDHIISEDPAGKACFPRADSAMIQATMPAVHQHRFMPQTLFPPDLIAKAEAELDHLATLLEKEGIHVHRPPRDIDWLAAGGYTGAMPRDGLMVVGSTIIEACFAWPCRDREISLAFEPILRVLGQDSGVRIVRRPANAWAHTLMDKENRQGEVPISSWVINNSRPAFDTADFMRFGKVILGQYSHVTNDAGVNYIRRHLPQGYKLEMLEIVDPHAMHIDATILPLRQGLLVFNPQKVTPAALRRHDILAEWRLEPYPFLPKEAPDGPPLYMTSPWLALNVLVLDGKRVVVEESDDRTAKWYEELGMECIRCPFRHVYSIGGSFHCTTVDLLRTP